MKKIMNTTLVAVALTIAFVGNVDAKQLINRNATKANQDAAKELIVSQTKENVENTKDALLDTNNEEEAALQVYQAKELELVGRIAIQKHVIAAMPRVGYIWDTRTETEKDARKVANDQLKKLEDDMKDTKEEIAKITKSVGSEYARSTKLAIGVLATVGVILVGYGADRYFETGYFPAAYSKLPDMPYIGSKARAARSQAPLLQESSELANLQSAAPLATKGEINKNKAAALEKLEAAKARKRISSAKAAEKLSPRK